MNAGLNVARISYRTEWQTSRLDNEQQAELTFPSLPGYHRQKLSQQRIDVLGDEHLVVLEAVEVLHTQLFNDFRIKNGNARLTEQKRTQNSANVIEINFPSSAVIHSNFSLLMLVF